MNRKTKNRQTFAKLTVQLHIVMIFLSVFFISCNSASNKTQTKSSQVSNDSIPAVIAKNDSLDVLVKSIIDIAANDFYENQHPLPIAFRNVQIKYNI